MKSIVLIPLVAILSGCFVTATVQKEPPMIVRSGAAPSLAIVIFSKQPGFVSTTQKSLGKCLSDRNVFTLISKEKVDQSLKEGGFNLDRVYGLDDAEYRKIAADVGADYVLFGNLAVVKALKLTGWRQDIYSMFYLHNGQNGKKVDTWRSDTTFTFADANTELDPDKMLASVVNHTCAKIAEEFK